jgi:hypothetical protein
MQLVVLLVQAGVCHAEGRLEDGDVLSLVLAGGDLRLKNGERWRKVGGNTLLEVPVSPLHRDFVRKQVLDDDDLLAQHGLWVLAVDQPAPEVNGSHDLTLCFRRGRPLPGKLSLEHKFVFGRDGFDAKLKGYRDFYKARLATLNGVVGQVLLVSHVSDTKKLEVLKTVLLWTDGGRWRSLTPARADLQPQRQRKRGVDDVWGACAGREHRGVTVKLVCELLKQAGTQSYPHLALAARAAEVSTRFCGTNGKAQTMELGAWPA